MNDESNDKKQYPSTFSLNVHGVTGIKCGFVILEHNAVHLDLTIADRHEQHSLTIFADDLRKFLRDLANATTDAQNKLLDEQLAEAERIE